MSRLRRTLISTAAGVAALAIATSVVLAQAARTSGTSQAAPGTSGEMGAGMMTGQGAPGRGMMDPEMMRMMMQMMNMMRGQGMGGPGMMGGQGMGPGLMQGMPGLGGKGMMDDQGPGMRVTPSQHLTTDDVSHFLDHFLERHGNPRLKVGKVEQVDEDTIVAEIVTVDDSLVQRFTVDRHTGQMVPDSAGQAQPAN
jgi:hypothetical protein